MVRFRVSVAQAVASKSSIDMVQRRTVLSCSPTEVSHRPSGLNVSDVAGPSCPRRMTGSPLVLLSDHKRTLLSAYAPASHLPSGERARLRIGPPGPLIEIASLVGS